MWIIIKGLSNQHTMLQSKDISEEMRKKGCEAISKALVLQQTTVRIISQWRKLGTMVNPPRNGQQTKVLPNAH